MNFSDALALVLELAWERMQNKPLTQESAQKYTDAIFQVEAYARTQAHAASAGVYD